MTEISASLDEVMNAMKSKKRSRSFATSDSFLPSISPSPLLRELSDNIETKDNKDIEDFPIPLLFCITEVLHSLAMDSAKVSTLLEICDLRLLSETMWAGSRSAWQRYQIYVEFDW